MISKLKKYQIYDNILVFLNRAKRKSTPKLTNHLRETREVLTNHTTLTKQK